MWWQSAYLLAVHLVTVCLCAVVGRLPRLLLVALPGLIDTLAQLLAWRSLLWLSMMWRQRYLTQSNFLSTTSLAWYLTLHLLFCFNQEKPLQWKEINTHTRTHTRARVRAHTHTHTHTHTHCQEQLYNDVKFTKGKYCQDIVIRNREFFLVNIVAFS